jgi:hypothetical protein
MDKFLDAHFVSAAQVTQMWGDAMEMQKDGTQKGSHQQQVRR